MFHILLALILALGVMTVSFSGKISTVIFGAHRVEKNMSLLASFSAGVFIVFVIHSLTESFELISVSLGICMVVLGYLLTHVIQKLIPQSHHHHGEDCELHENTKSIRTILVADGLHNMVDGIALAAATAISWQVGILAWISIVIHETVQEIGEYFALRHAGLSSKRALWRNFLSASTILIGVGIGFLVHELSPSFVGIVLCLAAGMFLSIIAHDLLPATIKGTPLWRHVFVCVAGVALMLAITTFLPHEEQGDEHIERSIAVLR